MRMIIFANGIMRDPAATAKRWIRPGDLIVAADGGMQHVLSAGLIPDHVIGDLDSAPPELRTQVESQGTHFHVYPPTKDETDLELALLWAAETVRSAPDAGEIVVLGALGGRPDQELANLLLLALPQLTGLGVIVADDPWTVCLLRSDETRQWQGHPGDVLSLIPLGGPAEGVTTTGLAYPLRNETLWFGPARGVSNVFVGETATVTLNEGLLWIFHKTV
ncbi:MAG: thiamine diphosphokinase [Anaerolineae bacterium]|nr:thiamine diphosphokinase [Anaerolineae bacterium]